MPIRLILILTTLTLAACAGTPERQGLDQVNKDVSTARQTISTARTIRAILQ